MRIDVSRVAKLANLPLTQEEEKKFEKQLGEILSYIEKLNEVDTKNIESTSQVTGLENVTREDTASPSLPQEEVLKNAPLRQGFEGQAKEKYNGFFKVKATLNSV